MQVLNMIFYTAMTLGILVFIHELGHFLAAKLTGMRTDVFSIGFGARLFGFNKRSGFSVRTPSPNSVTITITPNATGQQNTDPFGISIRQDLEQACRAHAASNRLDIIEYDADPSDGSAPISLYVTYARSKRESALTSDAESLTSALNDILRGRGVAAQAAVSDYSFEGAGVCDYRVALLPLGGYVKIAGMVDESFDTKFLEREPRPWEYRAKPIWARMLVISAGVIMNVILAVCIFWGINYANGKLIEETTEIGKVLSGSIAEKVGLQPGDRILSVNGVPVTHWDEIFSKMYIDNFGRDVSIAVERSGEQRQVLVTRTIMPDNSQQPFGIIEAHTSVMVGSVDPGKPADLLGLKPGDILIALDDAPVANDSSVIKTVQAHAGKQLRISWKRGEEQFTGTTTPDSSSGRIGIRLSYYYNGPKKILNYSLFEAFQLGVSNVVQSTGLFLKSIGQMIAGKSSFKENIGGPIAIAKFATQSAEIGATAFLGFLGMLSMSLALLNILPFPALDGGHLMMLLYEKIFNREIPHKVKLGIQKAGFIILLAFMAFVVYNDISRL